jgi:hypothetical protein
MKNYEVMKKTLLFLSFLILLPLLAVAEEFKAVGLVLGESTQTVRGKFKDKNISLRKSEEGSLVYTTPLVALKNGSETELEFHQGKLMRVRVYLEMPSERFQDFKEHYNAFKNALVKKYGRPVSRRELIPRSFNGNLSSSMLEGEIGYGSVFKSGDIEIKLMLKNKSRRIYNYFLEYEDSVMRKKKQEENEITLDLL